ncbi:hypothetical protein GCK72_020526 [Caenorhabditis remanei]|uniref:Uncharacterized protein n=1 Tax=Caenorhabditis remanei TaxID=31234 RepID=A0A6A5GHQ5_CAERE|nr:hypothetical protein GCK72_020526 [Caenorhabditis remanei]KAF1753969.1 hypothetical protein GCK72_020526 [Caenorhabditis remanei]
MMDSSEGSIMLSSSSSSMSSSPAPSSSNEVCEVCGDHKVNNKRYGAFACLGCTVFFRRSITKNKKYKCLKHQNCFISNLYRCACRYCRFQKCLRVGMRGEAIQKRDVVGPRNLIISPEIIFVEDPSFLKPWVEFQRVQVAEHLPYFESHQVDPAFYKDSSNTVKYRRRARAHDVDIMLKLCLKQATEWGNQLKPFKKLSLVSKKNILAEYCLAFLLIDQGFKTAKEADSGIWLLQNGSFMHSDYFFGLPYAAIDMESMKIKTQLHYNFVSDLLETVAKPFRRLEVDEVECAVLKILMLLKPSCSERAIYCGQEGVVAGLYSRCVDELMEHTMERFPGNGEERFGELILLISAIRCGVKTLYNQTRVSDLFNFMKFDNSVKEVLLT